MNKVKKISLIFLSIIAMTLSLTGSSFAMHDTSGKYLGLKNKGNGRATGFYTTGTTTGTKSSIPVIKIVEYNSAGTAEDQSKSTQAIYCLKDGVGFGSVGSSGSIVKYTEYFDLKDPSSIDATYKAPLPSGENYNKLVWLLDNICIPEDDASVNKLLEKVGLEKTDFTQYITDESELKDILEVIQQAAIWYITNEGDDYQPSAHDTFAVASSNGATGVSLGSKYDIDEVDNPISKLYEYLITEAKKQGSYEYKAIQTASPVELDKTRATVTLSGSNYLIGPYKLTETRSNYTLTGKVLNGTNEIQDVSLVGADKQTELTGNTTTDKIKSNIGKDFYISLPSNTSVTNVKLQINTESEVTTQIYWSTPSSQVATSQPVVVVSKVNVPAEVTDTQEITKPVFDLALRKFITQVNGVNVKVSREPKITQESLRNLATGSSSALDNGTTAVKTHTKDALAVNTNDRILYTIRIYNEGGIDGYADEIVDYLPEGLELIPSSESEVNAKYGWTADNADSRKITTTYLSKATNADGNLIKAFDKSPADGQYTISYKDVQVECKVVATTKSTDTHLKNVAEITKASNSADAADRDSTPSNITEDQKNNYNPGTSTNGKGYEDDDDYEDLVLPGKYFDLALRKFITAVNDTELKTNGVYDRAPIVNVSPLLNGKTTAEYTHIKKPVSIEAGDIVTYTIRVYNEGQIDGYVDEIVDHLPPELEFLPDDKLNQQYLWTIDSTDKTQRTIKTSYLSKEHDAEENLIKAFDTTKTTLSYKEVQIRCKVKADAPTLKQITNIAEITKSSNDAGLTDRDNQKNATLPSDTDLPKYRGNDNNKEDLADKDYYYEGQEDDDDFEKIILEKFDLALRKFITGVNNQEITDRVPQVDTSKFGTIVDGKEVTTFTYNHTKEPVRVCQNDTVIYTIRIYNEGSQSGYAAEIKDDIPDGLQFIVDNSINTQYRWVMYDKDGNVTQDVKNATTIRTDYLSKEQEKNEGDNLLKAFDKETMQQPDYKDVKVAFKVLEPNTSDRILINHAEISKNKDKDNKDVTDIDSTPDKWNEGEDDQDIEKIYVKYFDLALRKWVSQVILIEDGVQKEMDTGHYAEQDPEPVVKVELNKKRIENTIVKFRYYIRITNEGEIEGYAKEISDYIPEGLKFNQADNPKWKEVNGKIVTDQLKDTLLKPGESATVDVVLTWINNEENMGVKTNVAEISEDYNESGTADIDSTPNNKKEGEDDIDDAPVALTVVTGSAPKYIALTAGIVLIVGAGALIIKKYVI